MCPSAPYDSFTLDEDLHKFYRTLCLKDHFADSPSHTVTSNLPGTLDPIPILSINNYNLRPKSHFNPRRQHHPIETYITLAQREISNFLKDIEKGDLRFHSNFSLQEKQALRSLKDMPDIIIKPADKGGAIVVMDKIDYVEEIHSQLSDTNTYVKLDKDPTPIIRQKILDTIQLFLSTGTIDSKT